MEERIYEILSSACIENRLLSKEELKEIFNIYININELNNYVNAIEFVSESLNKRVHYDTKENKNNGAGAASSIYEKKIYFYYNIIVKTLKDEDNRYLDYNLVMYLLHEINHFQHYKIIDKVINDKNALENLDPIESSVFFLILSSYYHAYVGIDDEAISNRFLKHIKGNNVYEKFRNHYHKNHDLFPCERLADLDAIEYLRKLLFKYETNDDKFITEKEKSPCIRVTFFYNFEEDKIIENYAYYKNENDVEEENFYRENYCELPMKLIVTRKYFHPNGFTNMDIEQDIEKTKHILHDLITQVTYLFSEGATEEMINDAIKI